MLCTTSMNSSENNCILIRNLTSVSQNCLAVTATNRRIPRKPIIFRPSRLPFGNGTIFIIYVPDVVVTEFGYMMLTCVPRKIRALPQLCNLMKNYNFWMVVNSDS